MKKILSLLALAACAVVGLAPTPYYVGRFAGDGTGLSNVTAIALSTNTIHLQASPSIDITTNSATLNTPSLASGVSNQWKLDATNAAVTVVTYSNLPAAHLTGALPAIDGSALTGIVAGVTVPTNSVYLSAVAGNDSTAVVGNRSLPAATLNKAMQLALIANSNNAVVIAVPDGTHLMTARPTISNHCTLTIYAQGCTFTNSVNLLTGAFWCKTNSTLRVFGGTWLGDPNIFYMDEPNLVEVDGAIVYSPTGTPFWDNISPRNARKLVVKNCEVYGVKHLMQLDGDLDASHTNQLCRIINSRIVSTNQASKTQAGMIWVANGTMDVENSYILSSAATTAEMPEIWCGAYAWLNVRNSTISTLTNGVPALTNIALGYSTLASIYGHPCEPSSVLAAASLVTINWLPANYVGNFTGNGVGLTNLNWILTNNSYFSGSNYFTGTEYMAGAVRMADGSLLATNMTARTNDPAAPALTTYGNLQVLGSVRGNLAYGTNLPVAGIAATGIDPTYFLRGDGSWQPAGTGTTGGVSTVSNKVSMTFAIGSWYTNNLPYMAYVAQSVDMNPTGAAWGQITLVTDTNLNGTATPLCTVFNAAGSGEHRFTPSGFIRPYAAFNFNFEVNSSSNSIAVTGCGSVTYFPTNSGGGGDVYAASNNMFTGTNTFKEAVFTNGVTIGGVRQTSWPVSISFYTNGSDLPGVIGGGGTSIGTNLSTIALLSASSNHFSGDLGVAGVAGLGSATATSFVSSGSIIGLGSGLTNAAGFHFADTNYANTNLVQMGQLSGPLQLLNTNNGSGLTNLNASNLASGTVAPARLGTNAATDTYVLTATSATTAEWKAPSAVSGGGGTNSGPIALSFSDTNVAINASTPVGCVTNAPLTYTLTMTTNALMQNPTGTIGDGQRITIMFLQDATGSRLAYFGTAWAFGTDITGCTLTTTAAKRDFLTAIYKVSTGKWYVVGFMRGY